MLKTGAETNRLMETTSRKRRAQGMREIYGSCPQSELLRESFADEVDEEFPRVRDCDTQLLKRDSMKTTAKDKLRVLHEQIYDLSRHRCLRTHDERRSWVEEQMQTDRGTIANATEVAAKTLVETQKARASLERTATRAASWRYWSSIPTADRIALSNRCLQETQQLKDLKDRHAAAALKEIEAIRAKLGSDASTGDLRAFLNSSEIAPFADAPDESNNCPECCRMLVYRTRATDGRTFMGCDGYPGCSFAWSSIWGVKLSTDQDSMRTISSRAELELVHLLSEKFPTRAIESLAHEARLKSLTKFDKPTSSPLIIKHRWSCLLRAATNEGAAWDLQRTIVDSLSLRGNSSVGSVKQFIEAWDAWIKVRREEMELMGTSLFDSSTALCTAPTADGKNEATENAAGDGEEMKNMESSRTDKVESNKGTLDTIIGAVVQRAQEDVVHAGWRTAADEALEIGKPVAKQILKEFAGAGAFGKRAIAAIDTPLGEGVVALVMGWGIIGYGPLRGTKLGPRTMRLSKELSIRGFKPFTDLVAQRFIRPISKRLGTLIEGLTAIAGEG